MNKHTGARGRPRSPGGRTRVGLSINTQLLNEARELLSDPLLGTFGHGTLSNLFNELLRAWLEAQRKKPSEES